MPVQIGHKLYIPCRREYWFVDNKQAIFWRLNEFFMQLKNQLVRLPKPLIYNKKQAPVTQERLSRMSISFTCPLGAVSSAMILLKL
jgi:hypothetical protein